MSKEQPQDVPSTPIEVVDGQSFARLARSKIDADPSLIRGMHLADLLHGLASILGSNQGTADNYNLSAVLPKIRTFLSHNWCVSRKHKFLVLVYHYNLFPALLGMVLVCTVLLVLMALELLPNTTVVGVVSDPETSYTRGLFCLPLGPLAFFVILFSFHEFRRACCGGHEHTMFLDKTCINQVDQDLKMKGIQSLAAFLCHSEEMLVVYTDTYMQKLWTVYEVATWLMLHRGGDNMVLKPTFVPITILASNIFVFGWEVLWFGMAKLGYTHHEIMTTPVRLIVSLAFALPAFSILTWIIARYQQERDNISEHIAKFKFSEAKCFCEDDRAVVQANIVAFMKFAGVCAADATTEEGVKAFEDLARQEVPKVMEASFGRTGFPYHCLLAALLPRLCMHFDSAVRFWVDGIPAFEAFWSIIDSLFDFTVICPLVDVGLCLAMKKKCLRGWCGYIVCGSIGWLLAILTIVIFNNLTLWAVASPVWFAALVPGQLLLILCLILVYRPLKPVQTPEKA